MGRRTNLRLAQSNPPLGQGFRGFDRQRQNLGLHRLRAAAHQEISLPITLLIRLRFGHLVRRLYGALVGASMETASATIDRVLLLGPLQVIQNGAWLPLPRSRKVRALLASVTWSASGNCGLPQQSRRSAC